MLSRHQLASALAVWLASTLAGCCGGPLLSCRYGDPGCPCPAPIPSDCGCGGSAQQHSGAGGCSEGNCQRGGGHLPLLAHLPFQHPEPVPTRQHYDYDSPTPKFHPVPTRPVFEPQPEYPPAHLLAGPVPRRRLLHEIHPAHAIHGQPHLARPLDGEPQPARSPQPPSE